MRCGRAAILTYFGLLFAAGLPFFYVLLLAHRSPRNAGFASVLWWLAPGLSALVTRLIFYRNLRDLGWKWAPIEYLFAAYAIPVLYITALYAPLTQWGYSYFSSPDARDIFFWMARHGYPASVPVVLAVWVLLEATAGVAFFFLVSLVSELGWRGFLVPELARHMSFTKAALVTGFFWALWEAPVVPFRDYQLDIPSWLSIACYAMVLIALSFPLTWFRLRTKSIWPGTLFYTVHFTWVTYIFRHSLRWTRTTTLIASTYGPGFALLCCLVACFFWRFRGQVDNETLAPSRQAS